MCLTWESCSHNGTHTWWSYSDWGCLAWGRQICSLWLWSSPSCTLSGSCWRRFPIWSLASPPSWDTPSHLSQDWYPYASWCSPSSSQTLRCLKKSFSKSFFTLVLSWLLKSMYGANHALWLNSITWWIHCKTNLHFEGLVQSHDMDHVLLLVKQIENQLLDSTDFHLLTHKWEIIMEVVEVAMIRHVDPQEVPLPSLLSQLTVWPLSSSGLSTHLNPPVGGFGLIFQPYRLFTLSYIM